MEHQISNNSEAVKNIASGIILVGGAVIGFGAGHRLINEGPRFWSYNTLLTYGITIVSSTVISSAISYFLFMR